MRLKSELISHVFVPQLSFKIYKLHLKKLIVKDELKDVWAKVFSPTVLVFISCLLSGWIHELGI